MKLRIYIGFAVSGLGMGFLLTMLGFADYEEVFKMFTLRELRLIYAFIGSLVLLPLAGFLLIKGFRRDKKLFHPGLITGAIAFGAGWAVTGACPSIVLVQLGQGKLVALFTIIGIILGVKLYWWLHARYFRWDTGSCSV